MSDRNIKDEFAQRSRSTKRGLIAGAFCVWLATVASLHIHNSDGDYNPISHIIAIAAVIGVYGSYRKVMNALKATDDKASAPQQKSAISPK